MYRDVGLQCSRRVLAFLESIGITDDTISMAAAFCFSVSFLVTLFFL
jgi:hypothetical protein